jgi:RNA polymerase sigma factor (sigma-70 family)
LGTAVAPVERELGLATDHDLVAAVRRGDDRAFEKLYGRYQRRIAAYVYGMVNDYGRAEDITQEVFISALRRMRETERPIAFKPWIYEIAKNACIDQFRRSRRAEEVSFDAEEGAGAAETARLASSDASPDDAIDAKQQLDHLCGAFGGLSDTHHQILVLRELEGLSYREIGEKMGLSRPSVESTLFRARRRLTEEYDELVSGERCQRIQTIIVTASEGSLGTRDQRRLARHIAHCQPCRREARLAGLDVTTLSRTTREVITAKVAALLPFPLFFRNRKSGGSGDTQGTLAQWSGTLSSMAEPLAGWTKAAIAAVAVLAAGGAGVATHELTKGPSGSGNEGAVTAKPAAGKAAATKPARTTSGSRSSGTVKKKSGGGGGGGTTAGSSLPAAGGSGGTTVTGGAKAPTTSEPANRSIPSNPSLSTPSTLRGGDDGAPSEKTEDNIPHPQIDLSGDPVDRVENLANQVDPSAGNAVGEAHDLLDPLP